MAETIRNGKWHWYDMQTDLENAGAKGIIVDPMSMCHGPSFSGGKYEDRTWMASWVKDGLLVLSVPIYDAVGEKLTRAFAKVVEYDPFCRYHDSELPDFETVEWAKSDSERRYKQLESDPKIKDLKPLKLLQTA